MTSNTLSEDLRDLYQEVLLDHNKHPRNFGKLDPHSHSAEGYNPLCGDKLHLYAQVDGNTITEIAFEGSGCAISTASASIMTEEVRGKSIEEALQLLGRFHEMVTGQATPEEHAKMGKLEAFAGVREFPVRVKCATLCWHTLDAALSGKPQAVSTE